MDHTHLYRSACEKPLHSPPVFVRNLISPSPPLTRLQVIGYWISEGCADFSGIICPSARRKSGHNLVIFEGRLAVGDSVTPISSVATKGWS
jgi:hypothetical protein